MKHMKKICSFLLVFALMLHVCTPVVSVQAASAPSVHAHAYVIMDASTGNVLLSKNALHKIYPASTVKLMTALVVLDKCKTTKKIKVTKKMLRQVPSSASVAGLKAGSKYSVSSLLHMLLLPSAADAAIVLACGTYGTTGSFVKAMNKKAKSLSLPYTVLDNPIGLDIGDHYNKTYTTAKDFAILARHAMANSTIRSIVAKSSYRVPKSGKVKAFTVYNTNQFLNKISYNTSLYRVVGGKTGTTRAAGSVLITTVKDKKGHEIICAFFGNSTHAQMYTDIRKLLNYTFKKIKKGKLACKKGFWDTRFRKTNSLIQKYYNKGYFSVSDRFYPTKQASQKNSLSIINKISKLTLKPKQPNAKLSILDFSLILYEQNASKEATTKTDETTADASLKNALKKKCKAYKNSSSCSTDELKALSYVLDKKLLPSSIKKDVHTYITKEQAVQIADAM